MSLQIFNKYSVFIFVSVALFMFTGFTPINALAGDDVQALRRQLEQMAEQMKVIQEKLDKVVEESAEKKVDIKEMDARLNKTELHTATDKISLGIELRSRADSIHYKNMKVAQSALKNQVMLASGNNPCDHKGSNSRFNARIARPNQVNADNDGILTNKFRLNMKAKVSDKLSFAGRLSAYKVFGDSSGVKFNGGSLGGRHLGRQHIQSSAW